MILSFMYFIRMIDKFLVALACFLPAGWLLVLV